MSKEVNDSIGVILAVSLAEVIVLNVLALLLLNIFSIPFSAMMLSWLIVGKKVVSDFGSKTGPKESRLVHLNPVFLFYYLLWPAFLVSLPTK
jgi:hypothetical protein